MAQPLSFPEHIEKAGQYASERNWIAAAEHYADAFLLDPSTALLVQYAHMLKEAGLLDLAADAYRAAIDIDGTDRDVHLHLGHLLKRLGANDDALSVFQKLEAIPYAPHIRPEINGLMVAKLNAHLARPVPTRSEPDGISADVRDGALRFLETLRKASNERRAATARKPLPKGTQPSKASDKIAVSLEPMAHLVIDNGRYRATTDNPRMRINVLPPHSLFDLEDGWFELTLRIGAEDDAIDPILFLEHAVGWAEFTAIRMTRRADRSFSVLVRARSPLVSLRLDPRHSTGDFSVSNIQLRKLSSIAVLARAASGFRAKRFADLIRSGCYKPARWQDLLGDYLRTDDAPPYARWIDRFERVEAPSSPAETTTSISIGLLISLRAGDHPSFFSTLQSLKTQSSGNWQLLVLADEKASRLSLDLIDKEIKAGTPVRRLAVKADTLMGDRLENGARSLDTAFIGHIEPGDTLAPDTIEAFSTFIVDHPDVRVVYCDDDIIENGERRAPRFKPGWNADYIHCYDYVGRAVIHRKNVLAQAGGYRKEFPGSEDYDLLLRAAASGGDDTIGHLARPLWHYANAAPETRVLAAAAEFLAKQSVKIAVEPGKVDGTAKLIWPMPQPAPHVTIIIPTRDRIDLLERAVQTILDLTTYPSFDIIIVDNGSVEERSRRYFSDVEKTGRVSVLRDDGAFNFSRLNNRAADVASGSVLALVNNDIEVMEGQWLSEMVPIAADPTVGAVGAKLLYASGHVQHAGIVGGIGTVTGHGHKYASGDAPGYMQRLAVHQTAIAVTAACLVVETAKYRAVGGLDEDNLTVAFNDVDLCLKLAERGWRTVFTPWAKLYHHESLSRGLDITGESAARFMQEADYMTTKWGKLLLNDRFYSPSLTRDYEDFSLSVVDHSRAY